MTNRSYSQQLLHQRKVYGTIVVFGSRHATLCHFAVVDLSNLAMETNGTRVVGFDRSGFSRLHFCRLRRLRSYADRHVHPNVSPR